MLLQMTTERTSAMESIVLDAIARERHAWQTLKALPETYPGHKAAFERWVSTVQELRELGAGWVSPSQRLTSNQE